MMKPAQISLVILFLLSGTSSSQAQENNSLDHQVRLNKGDEIIYVINNQREIADHFPSTSFFVSPYRKNDTTVLKTETSTVKLYLKVTGVVDENCYRFDYQIRYSIWKRETGPEKEIYDPRYPSFGTAPRDVINCYLNDAVYKVKYCPVSNRLSVLNLQQIKEQLIAYLDQRNIPNNEQRENEITHSMTEESILYHLRFLLERNTILNAKKSNKRNENGEILTSRIVDQSADSTMYEFSRNHPDKKYTVKGDYIIDNKSGLILHSDYSSYKKPAATSQSGPSNQRRSEVIAISGNISLDYYSGTVKPTWIGGILPGGNNKVGLTTPRSILAGDVAYKEVKKNSDGFFTVQLDIKENKLYNLFFFSRFPALTPELQLYVRPGDSIFITKDTIQNRYLFTGRGIENCSIFQDLKPLQRMDMIFRIGSGNQRMPQSMLNSMSQRKESIEKNFERLQDEKEYMSEDLFLYLESEYHSALDIIKYYEFWNRFTGQYQNNRTLSIEDNDLLFPELPSYPEHKYLQVSDPLLTTYTSMRFNVFKFQNTGTFPVNPPGRLANTEFIKLLLDGYPFYLAYGNVIAERVISDLGRHPNYLTENFIIQDYLENCNHNESKRFITELLSRKEALLPGAEGPKMNLIGMNGKPFDWNKTKGKVVVLMLYSNYSREPYFAETLYKDYGENYKDVIVLRISPGTNYKKWKAYNERYSALGQQMYYDDGQFKFNEQFLLDGMRRSSRYLVIDRQGKIFRSLGTVNDLRGGINAALKQPPPPKTPFFETRTGQILPGVLIGIVLTIIFSRIILRRRLKKRELLHRLTSLEHKAIKAQLNPHFLFNCLNSIQNLIETNKQKEANDYLLLFAQIIRRILQFSDKEEISIHEEIETLKIYTDLERMRFRFDTVFDISQDVDQYNTMIPPLLLQPIVENAIIHGLHPKDGEKTLRIEVLSQQTAILFRISDNGVGRGSQDKEEKKTDKRGLDIVKSRIEIMNKNHIKGYSIHITDEMDQQGNAAGTTVEIKVPDEK